MSMTTDVCIACLQPLARYGCKPGESFPDGMGRCHCGPHPAQRPSNGSHCAAGCVGCAARLGGIHVDPPGERVQEHRINVLLARHGQ